MNFKYRFALPVSVDEAWPILLDLPRVAPCMPGAAIESGDGEAYVGRMKVKLGPIEMAYRGDLRFVERDDAAHRLKVEGVGKELRGGGGARAVVTMAAVPAAGGCEVSIDSDYSLSGRAAQFGSGMIDEIGGKLMKEFVTRLEKLIRARGEGVAAVAAPSAAAIASAPAAPAAPDVFSAGTDDNDALDLVGLAWGPVVSRAIPVVHFLISAATLIYVVIKL
mgnify:CR=1 FL=1